MWNPDRFLNDKLAESQIPIGVYANLCVTFWSDVFYVETDERCRLTFSAGIRGCLG